MSSWMNKIFSAGDERNLDQSTDPYRNPSDVPSEEIRAPERPGKIIDHEFTPQIVRYRFVMTDGTQFTECILKSSLPNFDEYERRPDGSYERVCYDRHGFDTHGPHSAAQGAYVKFQKALVNSI